ncbi:MAG TPA: hypothetical protein VK870_11535, partial [Ignavibacteriaceae bacterium]|nr:hypothetical protein [Ignavibacteriaceae bacterium]
MTKKNFIKIFLLLAIPLLMVYSCKDAVTNPPEKIDTRNFFPDEDGSYFYYNVAVFDSTGQIQS